MDLKKISLLSLLLISISAITKAILLKTESKKQGGGVLLLSDTDNAFRKLTCVPGSLNQCHATMNSDTTEAGMNTSTDGDGIFSHGINTTN